MDGYQKTSFLNRVAHSGAQRKQAQQAGYINDIHRRNRRTITTHAIDNVTPDVISDRDDGIFVELNESGDGYKVTVTIADVAAHVPLNSELARVAHERAFTRYRPKRAFTRYRPNGNDPMFPQELEERMSLEHGQERLGLSVVMQLDHNYQLTHTAFEPVIVRPDNVDYAMAEARAEEDPQFARMNKVAQGIFEQTFGGNTALLRDAAPMKSIDDKASARTVQAQLMVASYMLLANHAVASFFERTSLPFMYRNFDGTHKSQAGEDRACYATEFTAHTELEKTGLTGAYCHFTSPIRRGADFYNGHIVHYTLEIVDSIEKALQQENVPYDKGVLWSVMPELLQHYHAMKLRPSSHTEHALTDKVQRILPSLVTDILAPEQARRLSNNICASLHQKPPLPLKTENLQQVATEINMLNDQERDAQACADMRSAAKQKIRTQNVAGYSKSVVESMDKDRFSSAIRNCALTGLLPDAVHDEALKRITADKLNTALDAMHIMVCAHAYQSDSWRDLKKAMASTIKHNSGIVNNVLKMANYYGYFEEKTVIETCAQMPVHSDAKHTHSVLAAILYTSPDKQSPPYYSLGHNERAALTHARYSFLEKYAFGELQPLGNSAAPNLLYAGLGSGLEHKETVLKSLVQSSGANIELQHRESNGEHTVSTIINGGAFTNKITATAHADSEPEAKRKAIRKTLRQPAFMQHVQSVSSKQMDTWLNPKRALEAEVKKQDWQMRTVITNHSTHGKANFKCALSLYTDSGLHTYTGEGNNKSRAINAACVRALIETPRIEVAIPDEPMGMSWIDEAVNETPSNEIRNTTVFRPFIPQKLQRAV